MTKLSLAVLCVIALLLPHVVFSDCVDLGRSTGWYVQGDHTLMFYSGKAPIARVTVPNCSIKPSSMVRLASNYLCDSDKVDIDGEACNIMTVTSASTDSFKW